jgi:hypothetical protein
MTTPTKPTCRRCGAPMTPAGVHVSDSCASAGLLELRCKRCAEVEMRPVHLAGRGRWEFLD